MSDDEDLIVKNFELPDSDSDEDVNDLDLDLDLDEYDSPDEDTEDYLEILEKLLCDVADVEVIGLNTYKINFHDTNIKKLENKNCKCDFDEDDDGMPIMIDGGEEFIKPYLFKVSKKIAFFKDCVFKYNIKE
jgi:hypothetical protein